MMKNLKFLTHLIGYSDVPLYAKFDYMKTQCTRLKA